MATSQTYLHSFNLSDASCELNIPEKCDFVHCMVIDFSSTFDQVGHPALQSKVDILNLPPNVISY